MRPVFSVAMDLIGVAALYFRVEPEAITQWDRREEVVRARWAVMWVLREMGLTLQKIANHTGQQDHTTVIHGVRMATKLRDSDHEFWAITNYLLKYARAIAAAPIPSATISQAA